MSIIRKLGTIDCDLVETTPVVFRERLYRFEYIRDYYGSSFFRLVDRETDERTVPFAHGYDLGSAHVEGDEVFAYGVNAWGGSEMRVFRSGGSNRYGGSRLHPRRR